MLVVGTQPAATPLLGGVVLPSPEILAALPTDAGGDLGRARELAGQARVEYGELAGFDDERAEIEAFLARAKARLDQ